MIGKHPTPSEMEEPTNKKRKEDSGQLVEILIEADIEILVGNDLNIAHFNTPLKDKTEGNRQSAPKKRHKQKNNKKTSSPSSSQSKSPPSSITPTSARPPSPPPCCTSTATPLNMETRPRSQSAHGFHHKHLSKLFPGSTIHHQRSHSISSTSPPILSAPTPSPRQHREKRYSVSIPSKDAHLDDTYPSPPLTPTHKAPPSSLNISTTVQSVHPTTTQYHPIQSASTPSSPTASRSPKESPRTILDNVKGNGAAIKRTVSCPVINSCVLLDQLLNTSSNKSPLLAPPFYASPPHSPHHRSTPSPRFPSANGMISGRKSGDYKLTWWGSTDIGCRHENQDSFLLPPNDSTKEMLIFGVFDGHGPEGKHAATTAVSVINNFYEENPIDIPIDHALMRVSFLAAHSAILDKATNDFGTTAVVAALHMSSSQLYFGWVGDSKAVICRKRIPNGTPRQPLSPRMDDPVVQGGNGGYYAIELTRDHVLSTPEEMDRIYSSGGVIRTPGGVARVFIPELYSAFYGTKVGGLNMSRSLGHLYLSRFGVIPDPDYGEEGLHPNDLVILATDGLWGRMSPTEVCKFIADRPKIQNSPQEICDALIEESKARWGPIADNITILVLLSSQNNSS
eukprot:Phypoly_transcript_05036.p1 GENE.Phypoly_transcript_05036~~Phypoly_transcript_05036.p1  ORF type:complete len:622 (-),score=91.91 Phypoly_transcript_05036:53-1918(-)